MTSIPTDRGDYPVYLPPLRPLTRGEAERVVVEHLGALLRALGDLSGQDRVTWSSVLGDVSGTPEQFVAVNRAASLLAMVVQAHPEAAAALAGRLEGG
jgi:hypothetical protein